MVIMSTGSSFQRAGISLTVSPPSRAGRAGSYERVDDGPRRVLPFSWDDDTTNNRESRHREYARVFDLPDSGAAERPYDVAWAAGGIPSRNRTVATRGLVPLSEKPLTVLDEGADHPNSIGDHAGLRGPYTRALARAISCAPGASSSMVEQWAFNPLVQGSSPWGRTTI